MIDNNNNNNNNNNKNSMKFLIQNAEFRLENICEDINGM